MTSRFFERFLTPPFIALRHKKSHPLKYDFTKLPTPQKSERMSSLKINMFQINLIVVRVEGENNYIKRH